MKNQKNQKGFTLFVLLFVMFCIVLPLMWGYVMNIVKITKCDFNAPYKAEFIRGVGLVLPPVGGIVGYCTIQD